jgi:hypothetical protein
MESGASWWERAAIKVGTMQPTDPYRFVARFDTMPSSPKRQAKCPGSRSTSGSSGRPGREANAINIGGRLLGIWGKGSEDATALGSDHYRGAPLLHQAEPFKALKGNPVQLGNLKLAFRDLLEGPLLGRAQAGERDFHRVDLSGAELARTAIRRSPPLLRVIRPRPRRSASSPGCLRLRPPSKLGSQTALLRNCSDTHRPARCGLLPPPSTELSRADHDPLSSPWTSG